MATAATLGSVRDWVTSELAALNVGDAAVVDYVAGLAEETDGMDLQDVQSAVADFLGEVTASPLDGFLAGLLQRMQLQAEGAKQRAAEAKRAAVLAAKQSEAAALAVSTEQAGSGQPIKRELTSEERRQRQALLAQYDQDGDDDIVEGEDGELEIVYKDHSGSGSASSGAAGNESSRNRNVELVIEKERQQRMQAKDEHAKKVARDKELQAREQERKEKAKRRTERHERRRGPG